MLYILESEYCPYKRWCKLTDKAGSRLSDFWSFPVLHMYSPQNGIHPTTGGLSGQLMTYMHIEKYLARSNGVSVHAGQEIA